MTIQNPLGIWLEKYNFGSITQGILLGMALKKLLEEKKSSIIKKWVQKTIDSYAPDAAMFFNNQMNDFLNPVGGTIRSSLESLYDTILFKKDADRIKSTLEPLIKIRAVQNFTASQAVGFLFFFEKYHPRRVKKRAKQD
ncbi:MAG: RsbRD N-terminal domain-containing protein [Deltaproteobacteria bacterium]|nr:RsbRD N-terminal domain-containing protein [Deltaproteobacteria bacterium]